jgi:hypothetical protein
MLSLVKQWVEFEVYLTEETMEISGRFSPIFQTLAFGTANNATIIDMMVEVTVESKTKVCSSGNSFNTCTCKMNIETNKI